MAELRLRSWRAGLGAACCLAFCGLGWGSHSAAQAGGQSPLTETPTPPLTQIPAQSQPPEPTLKVRPAPSLTDTQTPALTVTTREVLMDVVATDKTGHPVSGLTAADFKITEEGAPQVIERLDEHRAMDAAELARLAARPALPPNTFTNYAPVVNTNASTVILLDAMDTPVAVQMRLRQQIIGYLKHMQAGASIAIFQMDTEMHLIEGFSSDQQALLAAMESKRDMPSMARPFYGHGETNQLVKMQILRDGMRTLGRYLAAFPGRKNLIWFTAQTPMATLTPGIGNPFGDSFSVYGDYGPGDFAGLTGVLTVSRVAVYPVDAHGVELGAEGAFAASSRQAPRGNSIVASAARRSANYADWDMVAEATGGKAYYNTNDMGRVIAEVVSDGEDYYTLAYATTDRKWNGQFEHVKISVERPGVTLECRPGYYAIDRDRQEQNQIAALERNRARGGASAEGGGSGTVGAEGGSSVVIRGNGGFGAAMNLGAVPPTEIVFTASLRAENGQEKLAKKTALPPDNFLRPGWRNKPFRNYTVLFNTDVHRIGLLRGADGRRHGRVRFVTVVYDPTAAVVNTLEKTVVLNLDADGYHRLLANGMPLREVVAVPVKGNYFLRLGVDDVDGDRIGALEIAVDEVKLGVGGQGLNQP